MAELQRRQNDSLQRQPDTNEEAARHPSPENDSILHAASEPFENNADMKHALLKFRESARSLQDAIGSSGEVHCILIRNNGDKVQIMFPVFSDILTTALSTSNPCAVITANAIIDALYIARKASERCPSRREGTNLSTSNQVIQAVPDVMASATRDLCIPTWFPWNGHDSVCDPNERPTYIFCDNSVMNAFGSLDTASLADLYATFFAAFITAARSKRIVRGKTDYSCLTPPWLRSSVVFVYGSNHNSSMTFANRRLPNKNTIRGKGNKVLGCAILATWIKQESSGRDLLNHLCLLSGLHIPSIMFAETLDDGQTS